MTIRLTAGIAVAFLFGLVTLASTQPLQTRGGDEMRGMVPIRFLKSRPNGRRPGAASERFRRVGALSRQATKSAAEIGVTLWKLRLSRPSDPPATREILVKKSGAGSAEWTPERLGGEPVLSYGDRFRIAVETPVNGHLYVIDRPRYRDGVPRAPSLIYPLSDVGAGDNRVFAGRLTEVPGNDRDRFLEIGGSPGLEAEEVFIVVAPSPLDVPITSEPSTLPAGTLDAWEREWSTATETFEAIEGAGRLITPAERRVRSQPVVLLTRADPLPQTIYRIVTMPGRPLLLRIVIRVVGKEK